LLRHMREQHSDVLEKIRSEGKLSDELEGKMRSAIEKFAEHFSA